MFNNLHHYHFFKTATTKHILIHVCSHGRCYLLNCLAILGYNIKKCSYNYSYHCNSMELIEAN